MLNSRLYRKKGTVNGVYGGERPHLRQRNFPIQECGFREREVFSTKFYSEIILWLVLSLIRILKNLIKIMMIMIMMIIINIFNRKDMHSICFSLEP